MRSPEVWFSYSKGPLEEYYSVKGDLLIHSRRQGYWKLQS